MLVGRPHVHASGEPLLMGTIGTYLQVHLAVVLTLTALISACATCLQRASECSPLSAGALTSACAACTSEMSFHLVSAGPIVCRCTLSVSFTLATTLGQFMTLHVFHWLCRSTQGCSSLSADALMGRTS